MSSLDQMFGDVRKSQEERLSDPSRRLAVRNRLLGKPRKRRPRLVLPIAGGLGLAAAAALLLVLLTEKDAAPLTFTVNDSPASAGDFLSAPSEPLALSFSDGSRVTLDTRSSGHVDVLSERGAQIRIEHGTADVDVVHRETTDWKLRGGPYTVHVVGTSFRMAWDTTAQRFELSMREGTVVVEGPRIGRRELNAGERLEIEPGAPWAVREDVPGPVAAREETPEPIVEEAPVEQPAIATQAVEVAPVIAQVVEVAETQAVAPAHTAPAQSAATRRRAEAEPVEIAALRTGDPTFDDVLVHGDAQALERAATQLRRERDPREQRVYDALRRRFASTREGTDAAFHLARRAQRIGDDMGAEFWLRTYLQEAPSGRFAQEASGRQIEIAASLGRRDETRRLAQNYLARWPQGAHAEYARQIVSQE
jgi:ferric-dicitrate binding protein FerR (iron transport regulator)